MARAVDGADVIAGPNCQVREQLAEAEGSYERWGFDADATPSGAALYDHLFAHPPIEWNRIGALCP